MISGVLNMTRGIGTALGVALASAIYTAIVRTSGTHATPGAAAYGLAVTLATLACLALAVGLALLQNRSEAAAEARPLLLGQPLPSPASLPGSATPLQLVLDPRARRADRHRTSASASASQSPNTQRGATDAGALSHTACDLAQRHRRDLLNVHTLATLITEAQS